MTPSDRPSVFEASQELDRIRSEIFRIGEANSAADMPGAKRTKRYPTDELRRVLPREVIRYIVEKIQRSLDFGDWARRLSDGWEEYQVVVAVLVRCGHVDWLPYFVDYGYKDQRFLTGKVSKRSIEQFAQVCNISDSDIADFIDWSEPFFLPPIQYCKDQKIEHHFLPIAFNERKGQGAFAEVYSGKVLSGPFQGDKSLLEQFPGLKNMQPEVAIKLFRQHEKSKDEPSDREVEWSAHGMVSHPSILPALASITYITPHNNREMILYPLAEGSLEDRFRQSPVERVDNPKFWKPFTMVLQAIRHLHTEDEGYYRYHFDLKPSNILVMGLSYYVGDLGKAYHKLTHGACSKTSQSRSCGAEYAAPEHVAPDQKVSRRFDIWALGCIGIELAIWGAKGALGLDEFRELKENEALTSASKTSSRPGVSDKTATFYHREKPSTPATPSFAVSESLKAVLELFPTLEPLIATLNKMLEIDVIKRWSAAESAAWFETFTGEVM